MGVIEGRTWLEVIGPTECWTLLGLEEIGRLAVLVDGVPEIYPVNFVLDGHAVLFRTDAGSKLRGIVRSPTVCFEVDGVDADQLGWSVMLKGTATELASGANAVSASEVLRNDWGRGEKLHWIRIEPFEVSGRRIFRPRTS
jgi:nitroimidazol reductase NimA-like FMN-containing flavoprotein (pyridoxamine 5'-phosphate oxidase superfamily)